MGDESTETETDEETEAAGSPTTGVTYIRLDGVEPGSLIVTEDKDEIDEPQRLALEIHDLARENFGLSPESVEVITGIERTRTLAEMDLPDESGEQPDAESPYETALAANKRVNDLIAASGDIGAVQLAGVIGYHVNPSARDTRPGALWKVALLQALDDTIFDMIHVDDSTVEGARRTVEQGLSDYTDSMTRDFVGERFAGHLQTLIDRQEEFAAESGETDDAQLDDFTDESDADAGAEGER